MSDAGSHDLRPPELIAEERIAARVAKLAERISRDYAHVEELVLVGILKGAFVFLSDLARCLTIPRIIEFMALSAYDGTQRKGAVRLVMDLRTDIQGRHVLIVEDIVDSGDTLAYLRQNLGARRPASLAACALVRKEREPVADVEVEYLGFEIPDLWAVGYGLDYDERLRTLPYIGELDAATRERLQHSGAPSDAGGEG